MATILIIDKDSDSRSALNGLFVNLGYEVDEAATYSSAVSKACSLNYDLIVMDMGRPKQDGIRTLKVVREECPDVPVVMMADASVHEFVVQSLKLGAFGCIAKPLDLEEAKLIAERALCHSKLMDQNDCLLKELNQLYSLEKPIGSDSRVKEAYSLAKKVARTDAPVFILGESGTGKEYLARAIHYKSRRACSPFIKVNCSGMSDGELELSLFGREKGATRKNTPAKEGILDKLRGGTIFLDEVCSVGLNTQSKLLRLLQDGEFVRVGGFDPISIDVRVISSTCKDISAAIDRNDINIDLYNALDVSISLPSLKDRPDDIPDLVSYFLAKYASLTGKQSTSISRDAMDQLLVCEWRGNIRELENCIEKAVILCEGDCIQSSHLMHGNVSAAAKKKQQAKMKSLRDIERDHIKRVLTNCNWNKSAAANILEIDRKTLRSKIREFGFVAPGE